MSRALLWKVTVETIPEAEEAVMELLALEFATPASSYTDVESGRTQVSVYLTRKPLWRIARRRVVEGLAVFRDCGLRVGRRKPVLRKLLRPDWAEAWKRHFKPIEVSSRLLIKPSWSQRAPRGGQAVIVLDPGLSFGTGQHPTTGFCLRQVAARRREGTVQSFLDIGTGSGILAIAAAKLGYRPVHAFDFDPESVRAARGNIRSNGVARRVRLWRGDVSRMVRRDVAKYDLVCANLISNLLIQECGRIVSRLAPDGVLVLAGILRAEFAAVATVYERAGLRRIESRAEKEWKSGAFARRGSAH